MNVRAIIFDFNGVIIDDEPLHMKAFQEIFARDGIQISEEAYYESYLALDDLRCIQKVYQHEERILDPLKLEELLKEKSLSYEKLLQTQVSFFPKVDEVISDISKCVPLAIASGARRHEIESLLNKKQLESFFVVVISADDVKMGKPHPESYIRALEELNIRIKKEIQAEECLVIEDSIAGIEGAHLAGMPCLAVAHTYPKGRLQSAELVLNKIEDLTPHLLSLNYNVA